MASLCHQKPVQSKRRPLRRAPATASSTSAAPGAAPPRPPSACSITACCTATACSKASAPTTDACSSSNATSIGCSTPPRPSGSRFRRRTREVCQLVVETCRRNGISDGYIRLVVTRGPGDLGIDPRKCPRAELIVIARQLTMYAAAAAGIKVVTSTFRRNAPDATSPSIKSLNYLNNILARIEANDRGADEALMLDGQGYVAEATVDNFFIVTERRAADAADRDQSERDHPRDGARGRGQPGDQGRGAAVHAVRRLDVEGGVHLRHRCRGRAGAVGRRPDDRHRRHRSDHRAASSPAITSRALAGHADPGGGTARS